MRRRPAPSARKRCGASRSSWRPGMRSVSRYFRKHWARPTATSPSMIRALIYLAVGDEIDSVRGYAHEVRELALRRGDEWALASILAPLCELECRVGDLETAAQHLDEGRDSMRRAEAWHLVP